MIEEINTRFGYIFQLPVDSGIIKKLKDFNNIRSSYFTMLASENAALATELLYDLIWCKEKETTGNSEEILVEKVLKLINSDEKNFDNIVELAEKLRVSREHLSRVFKKQMGISPYNYIVSSKIELSKLKLRNTSLPIKAISYNLGFTSQVQFSSLFKKQTGTSPGHYRKIYRNK